MKGINIKIWKNKLYVCQDYKPDKLLILINNI